MGIAFGRGAAPPHPPGFHENPRDPFRRRRRRVLARSAMLLLALTVVAWLLLAPHDFASVRLFEVSLGWWAALAAYGVGLLAVARRPRGRASP